MNKTANLAVALSVVAVLGGIATVGTQSAVKRSVLQQADIVSPGREAIMTRTEVSMGGTSGRHTHPGEEVSYMLEGTLVLEVQGKPPVTLKAGDSFMIPAKAIHNATNKGNTPAIIVSTYIVEKGQPLATPAQ